MRKSIVLFAIAFFFSTCLFAQQPTTPQATKQAANCTQVLRLARAVYEQGRLHELQALLDDCLKGAVGSTNGFQTVQEKVDAYRLLCLAYIYLEEPAEADKAMLNLLNTDHFFELNPTDPAEFQALYGTFRTQPIFSFGAKAGPNMTFAHLTSNYYVLSKSLGHGKYTPGVSFSAAGFAEKEFFPSVKKTNPLRWTTVRAELFFQLKSFKIKNEAASVFGSAPAFVATKYEEKSTSTWLDLNFMARYQFLKDKSIWNPYIGVGPGISLLLGSKINPAKVERTRLVVDNDVAQSTLTSSSYSGASVDVVKAFNKLTQSVSAAVGVNRRVGAFYINFEARYQLGFTNSINKSDRTVTELAYDYGTTFNDFRQSSVLLMAGATVPQFKPKKKLSKRK